MKAMCRKIWTAYSQFVEKQGFPIIVTVCVAIMTAAAVWSSEREPAYVAPTPPVGQSASAAQILQQSLREAATPSPLPTAQPVVYFPPLEQPVVLRPFHSEHMVQGTSGIWAIHDAVDLQSTKGTKVDAIADGHVIAAGEDALLGKWLLVAHSGLLEALYAGMGLVCDYIPGDDVCAGDTIGFVGSCMADEADLGPHLHLRVTKDGIPIDPCSLWGS